MSDEDTVWRMFLRDGLGAWHTTRRVRMNQESVCGTCSLMAVCHEGGSGVGPLCNSPAVRGSDHFDKANMYDVKEAFDTLPWGGMLFQSVVNSLQAAERSVREYVQSGGRIPLRGTWAPRNLGDPPDPLDPEDPGDPMALGDPIVQMHRQALRDFMDTTGFSVEVDTQNSLREFIESLKYGENPTAVDELLKELTTPMDISDVRGVVLFVDGVPLVSDRGTHPCCEGCPLKEGCREDESALRALCADLMGPEMGTFRRMSHEDAMGILEEVEA